MRRMSMMLVAHVITLAVPLVAAAGGAGGSALDAQVQTLTGEIAELRATVSAMASQMATLATAVVALQQQSLIQMGKGQGARGTRTSLPATREEAMSSTEDAVNGRVMLAKPQEPLDRGRPSSRDLRFLGFLDDAGDMQAFLARGKDLFIVRAGDAVDEHLEVLSVESGRVVLRDRRTQVETVLSSDKAAPDPS